MTPEPSGAATTFTPSVLRLSLMTLMCLVFVAIGLGILSIADAPLFPKVAAVLCVVLFGPGALFFVVRLVRRSPELTLTDTGLDHRQLGRIGWDEIASVRPMAQRTSAFSKNHYIQISLRDARAYLERSSWWVRTLGKTNQKLGYGAVNLPLNMLGAPQEEIFAAMRRYRPGLIIVE
ncbi:STM3941 family protein [Nocardia huaxiensis]|uniref:STM3941 family protein n=1 Tax=Nocardia huaxiensis TaxID=2755382 RepID=UPI001E35DA93|nr:STM3941 family protein [Nocardia huaxiensis]UFS95486.1 hypothetical protein LPY97_33225 [Nocardia huaxiensis]